MKKPKVKTFASVRDALAETPDESANLRVRPALMRQISEIVESSGVTQPRINDLLREWISRFSLDALVNTVLQKAHDAKYELSFLPESKSPEKC